MYGPSDDNDYSAREELDDFERASDHEGRLPPWQPRFAGEPLITYGSRVLVYVLAFNNCTALLTDDDLEQAEHAACYAVCSPDMSPIARAKLSACRHTIAAMLRARQAATKAVSAALENIVSPAKPNEGPMARLQPKPIVNPPTVAYGKPDVRF